MHAPSTNIQFLASQLRLSGTGGTLPSPLAAAAPAEPPPPEMALSSEAPKLLSSALGPLRGGGGATVDSKTGAKVGVSMTTVRGRLRCVRGCGAVEEGVAGEGALPQLGDVMEYVRLTTAPCSSMWTVACDIHARYSGVFGLVMRCGVCHELLGFKVIKGLRFDALLWPVIRFLDLTANMAFS